MVDRTRILFLCTGNSCRSQMAEGFARHLLSDSVDAFSAGTETHGINQRAVRAMADSGIDISGQKSKTVDELAGEFDFVFTLCDSAASNCPFFPARTAIVHRGFDDPPALTQGMSSEDEIMKVYFRVRGEIEEFVEGIPRLIEERSKDRRS